MGKFNLYECDTVEEVRQLIYLGHNIDGDGKRNSPIHCACERGNFKVFKTLYELGAKTNESSSRLLTTTILSKNTDKIVKYLIDNDVKTRNCLKERHVIYALRENKVDIAKYIINNINPNMVIDFNKSYRKHKKWEEPAYIIRDLCANDQNLTNTRCTEALEYILQNGADPNRDISGYDDAYCVFKGKFPLVKAAIYGFVEGVQLLIKYGATIHENTIHAIIAGCNNDYSDGYIHKVSTASIEECIRLIMNNSKLNINQINSKFHNKTPLMCAFKSSSQYVKMLINMGADILAKDSKGRTVLMHYCKGHDDLPIELIINRETIHIKDNKGKTALAHACSNFDKKIINILLDFGLNPNIQDNMGNTPIMQSGFIKWMTYSEYHYDSIKDIILTFIKVGCNINIKNKKGSTLLRLMLNNPKVKPIYINLLKSLGATYY